MELLHGGNGAMRMRFGTDMKTGHAGTDAIQPWAVQEVE